MTKARRCSDERAWPSLLERDSRCLESQASSGLRGTALGCLRNRYWRLRSGNKVEISERPVLADGRQPLPTPTGRLLRSALGKGGTASELSSSAHAFPKGSGAKRVIRGNCGSAARQRCAGPNTAARSQFWPRCGRCMRIPVTAIAQGVRSSSLPSVFQSIETVGRHLTCSAAIHHRQHYP